jgi:hypothetical protein
MNQWQRGRLTRFPIFCINFFRLTQQMNGVHDHLQGGLDISTVVAGKTRAMTSKCAIRYASWRQVTLDDTPNDMLSRDEACLEAPTSTDEHRAVYLKNFHELRCCKLCVLFRVLGERQMRRR